MRVFTVILLTLLFSLVGCQDNETDRLKEKAALEGQESAQKQIEAEKKYNEERSREMESDLARRQLFYQAVSGIYEGLIKSEAPSGDRFSVRLIISSTLPPYKSDRIRAPDEVSWDLNNLHLNVQAVMWSAEEPEKSGHVATGCVFEKIRPDLKNGTIHLVSSECKASFTVYAAELAEVPSSDQYGEVALASQMVAEQVLDGKRDTVPVLKGFRQANGVAAQFNFFAKKK